MRRNKKALSAVGIISALLLIVISKGGPAAFDKFTGIFTDNTALISADSSEAAAYVTVNDNKPQFPESDITDTSFEYYLPLDRLGRCQGAVACVGTDIMPTKDRGSIGQIKPSGWHTVKYDFIDGKYLYNRCHLIGYQLTGENSNSLNLITGTRYLNVDGMLPFENAVADYVKSTENHVMYRATPVFDGDNLLASGVQLEGYSVEDEGQGICFNVYIFNRQPGVEINYATGESHAAQQSTESR